MGAVECVAWGLVAALLWTFRGFWVGVDSPTGIEETRFALVVIGVAGVNVVSVIAFVASHATWGWWALLAVQLVDLVLATYELVTRDLWWWVLALPAAFIASLLLLARQQRVG